MLQDSKDNKLYFGDSNDSATAIFTELTAVSSINWILENEIAISNPIRNDRWERSLSGAGSQNLIIRVQGEMLDSSVENNIIVAGFNMEQRQWQLAMARGNSIQGSFMITSFRSDASYNNTIKYNLEITSAGLIEII